LRADAISIRRPGRGCPTSASGCANPQSRLSGFALRLAPHPNPRPARGERGLRCARRAFHATRPFRTGVVWARLRRGRWIPAMSGHAGVPARHQRSHVLRETRAPRATRPFRTGVAWARLPRGTRILAMSGQRRRARATPAIPCRAARDARFSRAGRAPRPGAPRTFACRHDFGRRPWTGRPTSASGRVNPQFSILNPQSWLSAACGSR
jgi:hypothetical protein